MLEYRNIKTGNIYLVLSNANDTTNSRDGADCVIYVAKSDVTKTFVRESTEFYEKFEKVHKTIEVANDTVSYQIFGDNSECSLATIAVCCCNCEHQHRLMSHPLVDGNRISNQLGWVCVNPDFKNKAVISRAHGACECYSVKAE